MSMWTTKRQRGRRPTSAWEREERRERIRHARWLVDHGAAIAAVAEEMGVSYETVRQWVRRAGKGAAA